MDGPVTHEAQSIQVPLRILACVTAEFFVVDLQFAHCSTALAPPAIPLEDLPAQLLVGIGGQSQTRLLRSKWIHDALGRIACRKARFCSSDKNLKNLVIENRRVSGFWLSRLAPARKSAQIISKQ